MDYRLNNGLFFMVHGNEMILPVMDEETENSIDFEKNVSPFLFKSVQGNFEIGAKFSPVNMSLSDSYGLYGYVEKLGSDLDENYCYITLSADMRGNCIKSGCYDLMKFENPDTLVPKGDVYLKMVRREDTFHVLYSLDGKKFVPHGKYIIESNSSVKVGFRLSSFQGSEFYVKMNDISIV